MPDLFDLSVANQLGSTVTLAPQTEASLIRAYGPDHKAQVVTVQLSIVDIDRQFGSTPLIQASAIIRWGIGGQQNVAEVDIGLGAIASFPASFVEVIARNEGFDSVSSPGFQITVSGSIGYGVRGPTGIPGAFKTVSYDNDLPAFVPSPLAGVSEIRNIPRWASLGVVMMRPAGSSATIVAYNSGGVALYDVAVGSGDSFPVVAPATKVQIVNNSGTAVINKLSIQYALVI